MIFGCFARAALFVVSQSDPAQGNQLLLCRTSRGKARLVAQPLQLIARTRRGMSMVRDKRMELADSMSNFNRCLMFMSDVLGKVSASRKLFIVSQTLRQSFFVDNQCAKSKKPNPCPHGSCLCQKLARCATSRHACLCWCESFFTELRVGMQK